MLGAQTLSGATLWDWPTGRPPATLLAEAATGALWDPDVRWSATEDTNCWARAPFSASRAGGGPGRPSAAVRANSDLTLLRRRHAWVGAAAACHSDLLLFQRCAAVCCTLFHTAGTRARVALKWTPGVTSPAVLDIASRGSTRAPVCPRGCGAECNPCAQVRNKNPSTPRSSLLACVMLSSKGFAF